MTVKFKVNLISWYFRVFSNLYTKNSLFYFAVAYLAKPKLIFIVLSRIMSPSFTRISAFEGGLLSLLHLDIPFLYFNFTKLSFYTICLIILVLIAKYCAGTSENFLNFQSLYTKYCLRISSPLTVAFCFYFDKSLPYI